MKKNLQLFKSPSELIKVIIFFIFMCFSAGQISAQQILYAGDNTTGYYTVDVNTGNFTNIGSIDGPCDFPNGVVAMAYDAVTGRAFAQSPNGCFEFFEFDPATGAMIASYGVAHVPAGLAFANGVLYGSSITSDDLITIDLNSGVQTSIGSHGIVNTLNGLAYDEVNGIMYGVTQGPGVNDLYTVNLTTGAATLIGSTGVNLGSLSFGPDGNLYGGGGQIPSAGNFYRINTSTGAATLIGTTGTGGTVQALMLFGSPIPPVAEPDPIPTMSQWGLMIFGLVVLNMGVFFVQRRELV